MGAELISASIPSPSTGELWLGPIPIRAYGILMVLAMAAAAYIVWVRYRRRGGDGDVALNAALWAIPFGLVGARLYHVITTPYDYFGPGADPLEILKIWEGGMAIFGGIAFGTVGAIISLRRDRQRVGPFADSLAPGLLIAQAIGRFGNYFNQELYGSPTDLPWGLEIDEAHLVPGYEVGTLFHPTFLYEALWNVSMALLIMYLDRRIRFKSGQVMALYLIAYPVGRIIMESMRLDEAKVFFGFRLNTWASIITILVGIAVFFIAGKIGASTRVSPEEVQAYKDMVAAKEARAKARREGRLVTDEDTSAGPRENDAGPVDEEDSSDTKDGRRPAAEQTGPDDSPR